MAKYDYDLIVIGGGAAGLTASTGAGQLGAKTLLIEKEKALGGDCLHFGCVPSKSLIKSAYCYNIFKNSSHYGLPKMTLPPVNIEDVQKRIQGIIQMIQVHDSPSYIKEKYHVETMFGSPQFVTDHALEINGKKITSKKFIIATGSSAVIPPIEGIETLPYLTNRDIFSLKKLPETLIVLGGGPIGVEMAQAFVRLGSKVIMIQSGTQLLPKEDEDIAQSVKEKLKTDGVVIYLNSKANKITLTDKLITLTASNKETRKDFQITGDQILISVGRKPNIEGIELDKVGILSTQKGIGVDRRLRTSVKNIFACGDVNGGYQFTHVAGYEGGIAMINAIMHLPVRTNYTLVPWCTYIDPEVASIGYNEKRARDAKIEYTVHKENFKNNDRALAESETDGFIKILRNKKGVVIGVQIFGYHAGDLIHEWVAALKGNVSLSKIAQAIHTYPTLSEINKTASGNILAPTFFNDRVKGLCKFLFGLQGN